MPFGTSHPRPLALTHYLNAILRPKSLFPEGKSQRQLHLFQELDITRVLAQALKHHIGFETD
jgi:uncharacterized protein (DUF3820 family)